VQRFLEAHQLAPHRSQTFELSNDPKFAEKLKDMWASTSTRLPVPLSSQIRVLDRIQPEPADEAGPRRHNDA
jgi:hypothetical protein